MIFRNRGLWAIVFASPISSVAFAQPAHPDRHPLLEQPRTEAPANNQLFAQKDDVAIRWTDGSDNAIRFEVQKRNAAGQWVHLANVAALRTLNDHQYEWIDRSKSISGQCYRVVSFDANGATANGPDECTVRPDGFPISPPNNYLKWENLSSINQGVGQLRRSDTSSDQHLIYEHRRIGVDLGLGRGGGGNNLKLQRTGNNPERLMYGEKVAMRVWGAGWVKYGVRSFGVNLRLSGTPSYEWYVLGGEVGQPIGSQEVALWNSVNKSFLVPKSQTWGVNLGWAGGPPATSQPPPLTGVKTIEIFNCSVDRRPLGMWVRDITSNGAWTDSGIIQQQYESGGSCPASNAPWTTTLDAGHRYEIIAIDFQVSGCRNDPSTQGSCRRGDTVIMGGPSGKATSTIS